MAMNGFLEGGVCYSDINAAYASHVSILPFPPLLPNMFVDLSFDPLSSVSGLSGDYYYRFYDVIAGVKTFNHDFYIPVSVFKSCDPIQPFLDGSLLGFTVAGAVISVSLLAVLRRAL